jgi:hypothetical protein
MAQKIAWKCEKRNRRYSKKRKEETGDIHTENGER